MSMHNPRGYSLHQHAHLFICMHLNTNMPCTCPYGSCACSVVRMLGNGELGAVLECPLCSSPFNSTLDIVEICPDATAVRFREEALKASCNVSSRELALVRELRCFSPCHVTGVCWMCAVLCCAQGSCLCCALNVAIDCDPENVPIVGG